MMCIRLYIRFSSPDQKRHVNYCHHLTSVVCKLQFSHLTSLVNQTWKESFCVDLYYVCDSRAYLKSLPFFLD